jgi:DNA polymerase III subunit delta
MKFEEIISDLQKKVYRPIYFLMGDEAYFIDQISDFIGKEVLDESEKEFNQSVLYGKEVDVATIIAESKRYPLMGSHTVVIVKEAQHIRNIEQLADYVNQPLNSTILVVCYKNKTLDKRKKLSKLIAQSGVLFESKKLYDNQVPDWIQSYLKKKNYSIQAKGSFLLSEYLGADLGKIVNELNKLMLIIPEGSEITTNHIEHNVGISKDFNNFELNNALAQRDILKANRIAQHFAANPKSNPLVVSVGVLFNFFQKTLIYHTLADKSRNSAATALKVNPFFVKDYETAARNYPKGKLLNIISSLREYDLKSKGVNNHSTPEGELLKELIYRILH